MSKITRAKRLLSTSSTLTQYFQPLLALADDVTEEEFQRVLRRCFAKAAIDLHPDKFAVTALTPEEQAAQKAEKARREGLFKEAQALKEQLGAPLEATAAAAASGRTEEPVTSTVVRAFFDQKAAYTALAQRLFTSISSMRLPTSLDIHNAESRIGVCPMRYGVVGQARFFVIDLSGATTFDGYSKDTPSRYEKVVLFHDPDVGMISLMQPLQLKSSRAVALTQGAFESASMDDGQTPILTLIQANALGVHSTIDAMAQQIATTIRDNPYNWDISFFGAPWHPGEDGSRPPGRTLPPHALDICEMMLEALQGRASLDRRPAASSALVLSTPVCDPRALTPQVEHFRGSETFFPTPSKKHTPGSGYTGIEIVRHPRYGDGFLLKGQTAYYDGFTSSASYIVDGSEDIFVSADGQRFAFGDKVDAYFKTATGITALVEHFKLAVRLNLSNLNKDPATAAGPQSFLSRFGRGDAQPEKPLEITAGPAAAAAVADINVTRPREGSKIPFMRGHEHLADVDLSPYRTLSASRTEYRFSAQPAAAAAASAVDPIQALIARGIRYLESNPDKVEKCDAVRAVVNALIRVTLFDPTVEPHPAALRRGHVEGFIQHLRQHHSDAFKGGMRSRSEVDLFCEEASNLLSTLRAAAQQRPSR